MPIGLFALLVVAWCVGWFAIREVSRNGLDEWIAQEASAGRRWSCADRRFGGFPFRIEIGCSEFTLDRPDVHASIGPLLVVSQIYNPRHIIAEAHGPLRIEASDAQVEGRWRLLQASVVIGGPAFERISIVTESPVATIRDSSGTPPLELVSRRFEAHLRPEPEAPTTYDLAIRNDGAVVPWLDLLIGGTEPSDIALSLDITRIGDMQARPLAEEVDRWRLAGGRLELSSLTIAKGNRKLSAGGMVWLDESRRPEGQIDLAAANLGGLLGRVAGGSTVAGTILGAILGVPDQATSSRPADASLKPLPPLRLQAGRLLIGPVAIPGIRIPALY